MKTQKQNTVYRLSLSILAAISIAACSDKSSPTGASPLPPAQGFGNAHASSSAVPAPPIGDPAEGVDGNVRGLPSYSCADFGDVRLRVFARGTDVVVQYAAERVPLDAFYYVRFWPEGRHHGTPIDEVIGDLRAGDNLSGEFVALTFDGLDEKLTLNYNVDIEMVFTEEDYERGEDDVGQCDRGGILELIPPVEPPRCESVHSIGDMEATVINDAIARFTVNADAKNFNGEARLEWSHGGGTDIVARAPLSSECARDSVTLRWETTTWEAKHTALVVRIVDGGGGTVESRRFKLGALQTAYPETWILN